VFKNFDGMYRPGRPNSGGDAVKFKFYATASVQVFRVNVQRSVGMALQSKYGWTTCGNVTIPANFDIPKENDIIEVRYLYAFKESGIMFQPVPVYLGQRDELDKSACTVDQLKFKAAVEEEES
jgi:bifunctional non-homologous end joining protein LigD